MNNVGLITKIEKYTNCMNCGASLSTLPGKKTRLYCNQHCRNQAYYRNNRENNILFDRWRVMIQRCTNPNYGSYKNYGARGIKVCERWMDFANYEEDIKKLGPQPGHDYSIDRINNDGDYEPSNVQWATRSQQGFNRRTMSNNKSGHRGVYWDNYHNAWHAYIYLNRKKIHLSYYMTYLLAVNARHAKMRDLGLPLLCCLEEKAVKG